MRVRIGEFLIELLLHVIQKLSRSFLCDLNQEQNLFSLVTGIPSCNTRAYGMCAHACFVCWYHGEKLQTTAYSCTDPITSQ